MLNLDDKVIFIPLFEELISTIKKLLSLKILSLQSLSDSIIMPTLYYLRDLSFVVLEFIRNEVAREVIKLVSELIANWKVKKFENLFEPKLDNKIEIRLKLDLLYI